MTSYFILSDTAEPEQCAIHDFLDAFERIDMPARGTRMGGAYPSGIRFQMTADVRGMQVTDVLQNALNYLMVTARLKALLEEHSGVDIEFLPFTLLNHKGRVASKECYIANVVGTVPCVDEARTEGRRSATKPGTYARITKLELDTQRIDPARKLFRIASQPTTLIIRDDLRSVLEQAGVTGAQYLELGESVDLR
ncbi:imm11 family protein [Corallococcus terminator]